MSARARMTMRVFLQRNYATKDPYGQPGPPEWQALEPVPCFAWAGSGKAKQTVHGDVITITTDQPGMIVPSGTDIVNTDRVEAVRDRRGEDLFGEMFVDAILHRKDHLEIGLRDHA